MATHDYVIANGTGAAVRSDLNGALAAIVSQNSSATEPSPTYAYQRWADTTAGVMKMRNGANSAWISLYELDGTFLASDISLAAGSAAAPSLFFTGDTNTGIYSPGADQVAISTGGTSRLAVSTTAVSTALPLAINNASATATLSLPANSNINAAGTILYYDTNSAYSSGADRYIINGAAARYIQDNGAHVWQRGASGTAGNAIPFLEGMRIDANGRLGVNMTPASGTVVDILAANNTSLSPTLRVNSNNLAVNTSLAYDGLSGSGQVTVQAGATSALIFGSNAAEKARIDSSGRFMVGTSSSFNGGLFCIGSGQGTNLPSGEHIKIAPSANRIEFLDSSSNASDTGSVSLYNTIYANRSANIKLFHPAANTGAIAFETHDGTSLTERMKIANDGNLLAYAINSVIEARTNTGAGTGSWLFYGAYSATGNSGGTQSFGVYTNGNVVNTNNSYGAISDLKLKENIVDANSQWADLKTLQVRKYNFKEGQTHTQIGLVAQEVELVSPGLVSESPDRDEEGNDLGTVTKSVNYSVLYMKAVKALQEAMERIEALEADVAQLKGA